jgi:hypothetical protein
MRFLSYTGDSTDVVITEGLEDTFSVYRYGKRRCRVIGLTDIGTLRHLKFPSGTKVTIVRDGDAPGSAGDKALQDGIDQLILYGVEVYVTPTPLGSDANDILKQAGVGNGTIEGTAWCMTDGLVAFLNNTELDIVTARRDREAGKARAARLCAGAYSGISRLKKRGIKGITLGILDSEVRKARDRLIRKTHSIKANDAFSLKDTPHGPKSGRRRGPARCDGELHQQLYRNEQGAVSHSRAVGCVHTLLCSRAKSSKIVDQERRAPLRQNPSFAGISSGL